MNSTKNSQPNVLVIIPTLGDRLEYLELALKSIRDQASVNPDIMVVFPLKKTAARKLVKKYGAIEVDDPGSMSGALNKGISQAKPWHEHIVWIGDDDLLSPDSLATSLKAISAKPSNVVAFGYCDYIDSHGKFIFSSRAGSLAPWIMTWGPDLVPMPGLMFKKSAFEAVGGFDENNKWCMDLDFLLKLRKIGSFVNTKATLASFRWHPDSQTVSNRPKVLAEADLVKRKHLPRYVRPFAFIWEYPVRLATKVAVKRVNAKALKASTSA